MTKKHLAIYIFIMLSLLPVSGCGTVGGALKGAGQDLNNVGDWVQEGF